MAWVHVRVVQARLTCRRTGSLMSPARALLSTVLIGQLLVFGDDYATDFLIPNRTLKSDCLHCER